MRAKARALLVCSCLASATPTAHSQSPPIEAAPLAPAQLQADFDLMRSAIEEAHAGLRRFATEAEMDRAFAEQRAKLGRPMTRAEFLAVVAETLAPIRCGHTEFYADEGTRARIAAAPAFPLRVLVEGDRLMVLFNDTPDDRTIRPGMEILEINGRKAGEILDRILPLMPTDGDIAGYRRDGLRRGFAEYYRLWIDPSPEFAISARDAAGRIVAAKLAGVVAADREKNANPVNAETVAARFGSSGENISLRFLEDPGLALIRIRGFHGDDYPRLIDEAFETLREKGTESLILDLRGNGGGTDEYGAQLVSCLTDRPFRYFDRIHLKTIDPSFKGLADWEADFEAELRAGAAPDPAGGFLATPRLHPCVAEQAPGKHPFLGRVFVLIDGGTYSTAADFCAVAKHLGRATFIGEETGGGRAGNNSGLQALLTLPNSKLQVNIPMYEYWNAVADADGDRRGTLPDREVPTAMADLVRGVDAQMDLARKLAAERR